MTVELDGLPGLHGGSVTEAARFAYRLLTQKFFSALALLWLPLTLAGVSLYVCIRGYFEELLVYLASPDPKVASLALGLLAGGVLLALFFWSIAASAVTDLALGAEVPRGWVVLRARRQEWRLYAGYLRFLLLLALLASGLAFFLTSLGPLLPAGGGVPNVLLTLVIIAALYWFTMRVGFLMAPIVATTSGMILRSSWRRSETHGLQIAGLMLLLLVPAILVQIGGEIVLDIQYPSHRMLTGTTIADYVRYAEQGLSTLLVISGIASFFAITLLSAGATEFCRQIAPPTA